MSELSYGQHKTGDQSVHQLDGDFDFQDIEELSGTTANPLVLVPAWRIMN